MTQRRIVLGVTGASGAPYALRLLHALTAPGVVDKVETHLGVTRIGRMVFMDETGVEPKELGVKVWPAQDMTAPFASGSARFSGMAIVPCSAGTLGRVAQGVSTDLVSRTADVMLKERRPLVMVLRESPYSLIQIRNMALVTEAGGVVLPASPTFYSQPTSMEALLDTVVARVLDQLGIDNDVSPRWEGRGLGGSQ